QQREGGAHAVAGAVADEVNGLLGRLGGAAHDHRHAAGRLVDAHFEQPLALVHRHLGGLTRPAGGGQAVGARVDQVVDNTPLAALVDPAVGVKGGVDDRKDAG